jgi:hypothetical protein
MKGKKIPCRREELVLLLLLRREELWSAEEASPRRRCCGAAAPCPRVSRTPALRLGASPSPFAAADSASDVAYFGQRAPFSGEDGGGDDVSTRGQSWRSRRARGERERRRQDEDANGFRPGMRGLLVICRAPIFFQAAPKSKFRARCSLFVLLLPTNV